jgi:hypothetical protein
VVERRVVERLAVERLGCARRAAASAASTEPYRLRSADRIAAGLLAVLRCAERDSAARTWRGSIG